MRKIIFGLIFLCVSCHVNAATQGKVHRIFVDPSDIVVQLKGLTTAVQNGPCGSSFFHLWRTNVNFKELSTLLLTAAASNKELYLESTQCVGDRNILNHGSMFID